MVGGIIKDFFMYDEVNKKMKFLVQGTGSEKHSTCTVNAFIPDAILPEIKEGDDIWWHSGKVYVKAFGCNDVALHKIGFSGGDEKFFYEFVKDPQSFFEGSFNRD